MFYCCICLTTDVAFFLVQPIRYLYIHASTSNVLLCAGCAPRNGTKHLHNNKRTPAAALEQGSQLDAGRLAHGIQLLTLVSAATWFTVLPCAVASIWQKNKKKAKKKTQQNTLSTCTVS